MLKKAVIFDFNGTLVFDEPFHDMSWGEIMKEILQQEMNDDIRKRMVGGTNKDILYAIKSDLSEEENEAYSKRKEEKYRQYCLADPKRFQLVSGAKEVFDYLKQEGIPFTIASASIKDNIDFFVEHFALDSWFDVDKIVYDDGRFVDKEGMYIEACKVLDVQPEDVIVIEDSVTGVSGAKKANIGMIISIGTEKVEQLKAVGANANIENYEHFIDIYL
jgi:beta-phosphoglucomutase-like phosphatase (HAD superfamily)